MGLIDLAAKKFWSIFANCGTSGKVLTSTGASATPTWQDPQAGAVGSITGLGTGVATALAVNVGSAGAPVVQNGAGGTPSSLTLTNATGLTVAGGGTGASTGSGALTNLGVQRVLKTSDTSRTSSTLTDDPQLTVSVAASTKYRFRIFLIVQYTDTNTATGSKVAITCPASPTSIGYIAQTNGTSGANITPPNVSSGMGYGVSITGGGALGFQQNNTSGHSYMIIEGTLNNGSNAGSLTLQTAQNTTNANATKFLTGSYMEVVELP